MLCFLAHQRLGGGGNLSLTCLYLSLLYMVKHNNGLGVQCTILLDNTCAENKNNDMIFFIAWLVAHGKGLSKHSYRSCYSSSPLLLINFCCCSLVYQTTLLRPHSSAC